MSTEHMMETRRRSRSKTPFLRSSCDHETCEHAGEEGHVHHHHHHKKKTTTAPNVHTITEEAVEVTSSSSSSSTVPGGKMQRIKTSDYSSEDTSPESRKKKSLKEAAEQKQSSFSTNTMSSSTSTTIITKSRTFGGGIGGGAGATSTPKGNFLQQSFAAQFCNTGSSGGGGGGGGGGVGGVGGSADISERFRIKEIAQNAINSEFERSQKAAAVAASANASANRSKTFNRIFGKSPVTVVDDTNGDISDHIAYLEYKRAGEYWKTTPKTDYTYSELSPHRRELAPGVVAMPNMSRRSLENHHERINYMIERDPGQEEFIRRRYENKYIQNRRETEKLVYDSGDDVDYTQFDVCRKKQFYTTGGRYSHIKEGFFERIITTIRNFYYDLRYSKQQRGFFGTVAHGISSGIAGIFRYIYLLISFVLCLDTWLLQSSNAENKNKKRFLLLLLLLLPLLLLTGVYYYLHPTEPFPPKSFSEMTFTLPALPEFPKIDMSEYLNEKKYQEFKNQAFNNLADFRAWTDDYFAYLKTVSQNLIDEGRKLFQREQHYERV